VICCVFVGVSRARAQERGAAPAELSAKARLRLDGKGAGPMEIDVIAALGRTLGERELRDLLAALRIEAEPVVKRGDFTAYLHNRKLGVELTFVYAEALDVRLRDYPPGALVLDNICLYGPGYSTHASFAGDLPFGLHFGDTPAALIAKFGPPDANGTDIAPMRWDTARYALFARLGDDGTLTQLSLQTPYVASSRPGFEER
jgi:hypothetical protein